MDRAFEEIRREYVRQNSPCSQRIAGLFTSEDEPTSSRPHSKNFQKRAPSSSRTNRGRNGPADTEHPASKRRCQGRHLTPSHERQTTESGEIQPVFSDDDRAALESPTTIEVHGSNTGTFIDSFKFHLD